MRLTPSAARDTTVPSGARVLAGNSCRSALTRAMGARRVRGWLGHLTVVAAVAGIAVVATLPDAHAEATHVLAQASSLTQVLHNIRSWLMGILATLATVFLTVGGVRYLVAGSDPSEVEKAKQAFRSAGWGYALAALAPLLVSILQGIVGA